jgi:hypothetical protein
MIGLSPENIKILSFIFDRVSQGRNPRAEFNKFLLELVKNRVAKPNLLKTRACTVDSLTFEETVAKMRPYATSLYRMFDEIATPIRLGVERNANSLPSPKLREYKSVFDIYDTNGDGFLDGEEVKRAFCNIVEANEELEEFL